MVYNVAKTDGAHPMTYSEVDGLIRDLNDANPKHVSVSIRVKDADAICKFIRLARCLIYFNIDAIYYDSTYEGRDATLCLTLTTAPEPEPPDDGSADVPF